jgi:hypothetical protein
MIAETDNREMAGISDRIHMEGEISIRGEVEVDRKTQETFVEVEISLIQILKGERNNNPQSEQRSKER